jgi:predicted esterase
MEKARHYLRVLPDSALGNCAEVLVEAAAIIRDEVHAEAMDRLQPFVDLAEQAENARKQGREPVDKAEQLLARAVTGWLLGAAAAEGKPEVARKLWRARQFATTYVRTHTTRMRHALLESYEKSEPTELEELGRIINLLPPAEPDDDFTVKEPMDRKTSLPNGNRGPVDYRVQLPLEYQHGRPHPLFVVLPNENENLTKTVGRYRYEAMRNGYILVAADWSGGFGAAYGYSSDEHLRVLDVIRDVRLRYNVDSDRIILGGFGEGANAAWDIGLSHPDLFAAIVPIAAQPKANVLLALWPNCAYTPVYAVTGEMMGYATRNINRVITDCVAKSYPCLHVVYRGRGYEWYSAELATAFEWMNKRKRLSPFPEIGRWPFDDRLGTSMCSIRQTDNRFWWLSTDAIKEMHMLDSKPNSNVTPARMQAVVKANNQVVVATWGLKQVTVWFGLGMIDFTRPVTIKLTGYRDNPNVWDNGKKPLKMSLSLMMEDLYERGDKTRLYVAQVRLSP